MSNPGNATAFDPVIFAYTRAQAIEDGILVDVSDTAREAGFKIPVASPAPSGTASSPFPRATAASRTSRAALGRPLDGAPLRAPRLQQRPRDHVRAGARHPQGPPRQQPAAPQAHPIVAIGAGDEGEPTITIMFPEDD